MDSPAAPFTLTSNLGATATLTLNDVRNGGIDDGQPSPNFGGSGDLMDGLANGTEDPYDESAKFDMAVSGIPYPVYDLIVYLRPITPSSVTARASWFSMAARCGTSPCLRGNSPDSLKSPMPPPRVIISSSGN